MPKAYARLTTPLVRDGDRLTGIAPTRELGRGPGPRGCRDPAGDRGEGAHLGRALQLLEGHQRGQLPRTEVHMDGRCSAPTISTAVIAPDTRTSSPVRRRFRACGGKGSYREAEETDLIVLWGSNARETHPIFFHHVCGRRRRPAVRRRPAADELRGVGRLGWESRRVGHRARERDRARDHRRRAREPRIHRPGDRRLRGVHGRSSATRSSRPSARRACPPPRSRTRARVRHGGEGEICWTLGITEHHNAVDNVLALINLALVTGHVGHYGSALNPLRGQNNVQGGGDMGALRSTAGSRRRERPAPPALSRWSGASSRRSAAGTSSGMFEAIYGTTRGALRDRREPAPVRGGPPPH